MDALCIYKATFNPFEMTVFSEEHMGRLTSHARFELGYMNHRIIQDYQVYH